MKKNLLISLWFTLVTTIMFGLIYPLAVTATSTNPEVGAYIQFLKSPAAKPAFEKQGFVLLQ